MYDNIYFQMCLRRCFGEKVRITNYLGAIKARHNHFETVYSISYCTTDYTAVICTLIPPLFFSRMTLRK